MAPWWKRWGQKANVQSSPCSETESSERRPTLQRSRSHSVRVWTQPDSAINQFEQETGPSNDAMGWSSWSQQAHVESQPESSNAQHEPYTYPSNSADVRSVDHTLIANICNREDSSLFDGAIGNNNSDADDADFEHVLDGDEDGDEGNDVNEDIVPPIPEFGDAQWVDDATCTDWAQNREVITSSGYGNYDWDQVCFQLLGEVPEEADRHGATLHLAWLRDRFSLPPPNNATELVLSHYAKAYILYMMGSTLFTTTTGDSVSLLYLPLLYNLHQAKGYSWGGALLACLYRNLCRTCTRGVRQMSGCVLFLQRLHVACPARIPRVQNQEDIQPRPIGARWTTGRTFQHNPNHVLNFCRDELDQQMQNQVIWEPYTTSLIEDAPMVFLIGQHIWRAQVPLIFFEIVEIHCPDRVMRQFGLGQHIPDPIDTDDRLHQLSRRGRGEENWNVVHSDYIQLWKNREHFVAQECLPLPSSDEYMHWYLSITRRYITPRPTRLPFRRLDYQPHGSTLHRLINSCERMARSAAVAVRDSVNDAARTVANNWLCSCRNALEDVGHGDHYHAASRDVTRGRPSSPSDVRAPARQ